MQCPECNAEQPDGAAICSKCDAILDPSFLGEDAAAFEDDEGTDPGLEAPAAEEGEAGTQIFDAGDMDKERARRKAAADLPAPEAADDEAGTFVGPPPERAAPPTPDEDDGEYEYEDEDEDEWEDEEEEASPAAAASPKPEPFDYRKYVPEEPAPDPAPTAAPGSPRARGGAIGRSRPGSPSPAISRPSTGETSDGIRGALEFDTSSEMLDDYEAMVRQSWKQFMALPATEKVSVIGALLAALTVLFPWRIGVSPAGVADETIGLMGMGWVGLLLAVGALGLAWYRLTQAKAREKARLLALSGVGICGAGLLWSVVSLAAAASSGTAMVGNPHAVTPGPGYGLFMHLVAWTVAGIGAVVSLKDLPSARHRR